MPCVLTQWRLSGARSQATGPGEGTQGPLCLKHACGARGRWVGRAPLPICSQGASRCICKPRPLVAPACARAVTRGPCLLARPSSPWPALLRVSVGLQPALGPHPCPAWGCAEVGGAVGPRGRWLCALRAPVALGLQPGLLLSPLNLPWAQGLPGFHRCAARRQGSERLSPTFCSVTLG